jgi:uncharacterized protein (TIGR02466 family)|tara:strand:+ start:59 stop:631 length:573 start_codon:yes stop_codon:yes gene_type:complete
MEVRELFACPVYVKQLNCDHESIAEWCLKQKKFDRGRIKTNVGGWQSTDYNGRPEKLSNLFTELQNSLIEYCKSLQIVECKNISNYWINVNGYQHCNLPHIHPRSVLSAVYYPQVPYGAGHLVLEHPMAPVMVYDWNDVSVYPNRLNSAEYLMYPEPGDLVIFPSWLKHYVEPNLNKDIERISISFNVSS